MPLFIITSAAALVVSFGAKLLADALLNGRVSLIGSIAGLQYSRNPGIAFGVRLPDGIQEIFIVTALCFVCFLAWKSAATRLSYIGYGLIVGGALGNVIDRIRDGYVTDFFQVGTFPIFNVADSCITIGVVLLLVEMIFFGKRARQ